MAEANSSVTEKRCSKCQKLRSRDQFYRRAQSADGLQNRCKPCQHADSAARAKANPAKHSGAAKKWRAANPERSKAISAAWARMDYAGNKEQHREKHRRDEAARREALGDRYVRSLIAKRVGCARAEVPRDLVAAKREWLRVSRKLNEDAK